MEAVEKGGAMAGGGKWGVGKFLQARGLGGASLQMTPNATTGRDSAKLLFSIYARSEGSIASFRWYAALALLRVLLPGTTL